ncbi:MAG: Cro/Cl family transcriptional regulator [Carnobacterium sp.]
MLISESWVIVYEKPGIMPSLHFTENFKRIFNVTEEEIRD